MKILVRGKTPELATLLLCSTASLGVAAAGLVDDTSASLNLRNFYHNRNFVDRAYPQGKAEEWTQSFIFDLRSGFTQGSLGFGVDLLGLYSVKLDGGRGTAGTQLLPVHDGGRPADDFGRLGVAVKAKYSATELKVGEWASLLPILRSDDGRSLPQTFRGAQITSREIENLTLYTGQFRGNSPRNDASMERLFMSGRPDATSDRFNFAGGEYQFNDKATQVGLWYAQLEDIYQQQYLNVIHSQAVGTWRLGANLGLFLGDEHGSAKAGQMDNKTASLMLSAKTGGQTFSLGLQRVYGETGWMRVNGTAGYPLANDTYNSSYDSAHERSWQLRHDFDFVVLGVPGLTLMNRYLSGDHVHTSATDHGKEWGRESELAYVFQSGPLKDLSVRWRNSTLRRDFSTYDIDENRLIVNYPIKFL
ncbi:OprD family porin [Pseudomonas wadenswilerensis]|uniref:Porin-like protein GalP n=1 Tax=Pseudomonas wadenswilerensis TaxID=1785161 RepID=A0A380T8Y0_9PSED|nr:MULTISPECIES: OprD family porin [Pseudomonas]SPO66769.1 Porin-like protein GalP [Pseudomonas sp. JV241A]SUQ65946.1 Porin-like protein GalP [Pseudomonas wadenswilerensis]